MRIFLRQNIDAVGVQVRQRRIQHDDFAGTGRPGDLYDPMRLDYQTIELRQHRWAHTKMLQIEAAGFLV